jgi:hypothetical protein
MSQPSRFGGYWNSNNGFQVPSQSENAYWNAIRLEERKAQLERETIEALDKSYREEAAYHLGLAKEDWLALLKELPNSEDRIKRLQESRWEQLPEPMRSLLRRTGSTDYQYAGFNSDAMRLHKDDGCYVWAEGFVRHFLSVNQSDSEWRCIEITSIAWLEERCRQILAKHSDATP